MNLESCTKEYSVCKKCNSQNYQTTSSQSNYNLNASNYKTINDYSKIQGGYELI